MEKVSIIDTHTGGEPTRVVMHVEPTIAGVTAIERLSWLRDHADWVRRSTLLEPRGCESMVGAMVGPPSGTSNQGTIVFFNNTGYLGMCGHGLIGVVEALRYCGRISVGRHRFETPVGDVEVDLHNDHSVSFQNIRSYRYRANVTVQIAEQSPKNSHKRTVTGDIAFGGNWFFLTPTDSVRLDDIESMRRHCKEIYNALIRDNVTGRDASLIDHIELFAPLESDRPMRGGRNFVVCPGGHYDRSPCGTGTSAKLACLAADAKLQPGETWIQESVIGSQFSANYVHAQQGGIVATVTGKAYVTGESTCLFDPDDPFRYGIDAAAIKKSLELSAG